jgi:hypothetical protein
MIRKGILGFLLSLLLSISIQAQESGLSLEEGFRQPSAEKYGIRCFWWWLNGNVTKEAITRDLEEMKAKGFSGALVVDAGTELQWGDKGVPAGPMYMSDAWRQLSKHAVQEAGRLGLELSMNIQSGWNLGGPIVTPEYAAKTLTWSKTVIDGSVHYEQALPEPQKTENYYRDIAVLAYPVRVISVQNDIYKMAAGSEQKDFASALAGDGDVKTFWVSGGKNPGRGPTPAKPEWLEIRTGKSILVSGVRILGRKGYGPKECQFEVSSDGKAYQTIDTFSVVDNEEIVRRCKAVSGKCFRLKILQAYDPTYPGNSRNVQIAEFNVLSEDGKIQPQKKEHKPIRNLEEKSMFHELGMSVPDCRFLLTDETAQPDEEDMKLKDIIDLTDKMDAKGVLKWDCPAGKWEVLRMGYTVKGAKVATSSDTWKGLVVDYMDPVAVRFFWQKAVEPALIDIGPAAGTTVKYLYTDSWECGGANWTPRMRDNFKQFCGYDLVPYLPVITGKIVENRDVSNRFLADFRKTLGDNIAGHYQLFADLARQYNMGIHPESAGPHAGPFDGIKDYGRSEIMMSEFWVPSNHRPKPVNRFFVKQAASAAHIYGKKLVGAEAFTSIGPHWTDAPWKAQKPSFDHEVCSGLNLVFTHTFTCSPKEMGIPGQEYFAGTHFNPQITWWDQTPAFITYLNRCQYLLQQGRFVADVLYYYGDHVPNLAALKESDPAWAMPGFDYDTVNEEVLLKAAVRNGLIVLPSGMQYRILTLPDHKVLSLAVLKKVKELVEQGAVVLGPKPEKTVSLVRWPACDEEFHTIADYLWGDVKALSGSKTSGQGKILWGKTARQSLLDMQINPDMEVVTEPNKVNVDFIHYIAGDADVYFVCNQSDRDADVLCTFRVASKQPELWDAVSGQIKDARAFTQKDGRISVPLRFAPYGSVFVVFRKSISVTNQATAKTNYPEYKAIETLEGPWSVQFEPRWGGPAKVTFDSLISWTKYPDQKVQYYSGKAVYRKTVSADWVRTGKQYMLGLGQVEDLGIAQVRLNGKDLGVIWAKPFQVDVTGVLKNGQNALEISVVNSWRNRLLGDEKLPADKRFTRTNIQVRKEWQLLDSGLLGPVQFWEEQE